MGKTIAFFVFGRKNIEKILSCPMSSQLAKMRGTFVVLKQ